MHKGETTMKSPIRAIAAAAVLFAPLLAATGAEAHAHLVKSVPAAASAGAAPKALHLEFSEKLEPKFSKAALTKGGVAVAAGSVAKGKAIDVSPKAALTAGAYSVAWSVVSADGHKSKGDYSFTVK
jgi:methionine-rich copper-binding protein CopC